MSGACKWEEDQHRIFWTGCGHCFPFYDDLDELPGGAGPELYCFKFCCYCGKPLEEIRHGVDIDRVHRRRA